ELHVIGRALANGDPISRGAHGDLGEGHGRTNPPGERLRIEVAAGHGKNGSRGAEEGDAGEGGALDSGRHGGLSRRIGAMGAGLDSSAAWLHRYVEPGAIGSTSSGVFFV